MINFFRKTRKKMADDNKPMKYMRYAVGEILLVVIGILIALSINNWNKRRLNENKIVSFLQEVKKNLAVEIEKSKLVIEYYNKKDSLLQLITTDKITRQDSEHYGAHSPQFAIMNWWYIDINRNAYNNMILISNEIPPKYISLYEDLYNLYNVDGIYVEERKEKLYSKMQDFCTIFERQSGMDK